MLRLGAGLLENLRTSRLLGRRLTEHDSQCVVLDGRLLTDDGHVLRLLVVEEAVDRENTEKTELAREIRRGSTCRCWRRWS